MDTTPSYTAEREKHVQSVMGSTIPFVIPPPRPPNIISFLWVYAKILRHIFLLYFIKKESNPAHYKCEILCVVKTHAVLRYVKV